MPRNNLLVQERPSEATRPRRPSRLLSIRVWAHRHALDHCRERQERGATAATVIARHRAALVRLAILAAAMLAGSCVQILGIEELSSGAIPDAAPDAIPDAPDAIPDAQDAAPQVFAVRGTASGVLGPVSLELHIGDAIERLTVMQDGSFAFQARLEDGVAYTVTFADPGMPCILRNESGAITGADPAIELMCTVPALASVVVAGIAPVVTLVPGTTEYVIDLPLLQQAVTVTATLVTAGDALTIAGTPVASGAPSAEILLRLGDNPVDIVVENDLGWQHTYRLILRRAGQLAQYAYGKASNTAAGDRFGYSVALSGDTLAVGAPDEASAARGVGGDQADDSAPESGAVYVFRRTGTAWRQEAYVKASNTGAHDRFGLRVALAGDTLAVGAPGEASAARGVGGDQADNSAADSGAVYVFRRSGATWQQEGYLKASNTGAGDEFGFNVALSDDTLAVTARGEDSAAVGVGGNEADNSAVDSGAVYVFRRSGALWRQEAYVKASNTGAGDAFGRSVALSGDTLAVGAHQEASAATGIGGEQADNSAPASGAVYVLRHTTSTGWQQEAYVKASNTGAYDNFGWSVALSGDTLAVGADGEDSAARGVGGNEADNRSENSGAAYVFRRAGKLWQQEAYVKASNTGANDALGHSMTLSGDLLAVGADSEDSGARGVGGNEADNGATQSGAVYVFRHDGTAWRQTAYLKASNTGAGDLFGWSVAVSGDTLAVGAFWEASAARGVNGDEADDSAAESGAVYILH